MKKTITFLSDCIANAFDGEIVARGNVEGEGGRGGVALTKSPKLFPLVILQPIKPFPHLVLLCINKNVLLTGNCDSDFDRPTFLSRKEIINQEG